jgi:class 3 adenylate cyclase/CHASE2 domain-containing sensor protein
MNLFGFSGVRRAVRRWYRPAVVIVLAIGATIGSVASGGTGPGEGLMFDLLVFARSKLAPPTIDPRESPIAVVAIDVESLDADELKDRPRALMAPEWSKIIEGLLASGARVVGFDVIFAYSGNQLVPEFDAPLLETLGRHRERVVIARSEATLPYIAYVGAVGAIEMPERLGMAALDPDADGVFRRVRGALPTGEPTLTRAILTLAREPSPPTVLLAPTHHMERIPTYAMADVLRCANSEPAALRQAFGGKIVMVGGTHPDEDRKLSSSRWLPAPVEREPPVAACGLKRLPASAPLADTVPGVHIHAAALDAVVSRRMTSTATPWAVGAVSGTAALGAAWLALAVSPWMTAVGVAIGFTVLFALATIALSFGWWLPLALPLVAAVGAPAIAYVLRYLVEERLRRRIAEAFTRFAPKELVERLAEDPEALTFGGAERDVTIMFADLTGSTELSGRIAPQQLMAVVNRYLAAVADTVEETGGYVDKFIGDAVMGLWGTPIPHPHHALGAVRAAMAAERVVAEMSARGQEDSQISVKIGINSGRPVVGLVGTSRRYNYTAVGEPVNIAARLEGLPTLYGCRIVLGEATAALVADDVLLRELDRVLVKGGISPIRIYQPIVEGGQATAEHANAVKRFAEALALYRARRFEEAAELWEKLATQESPGAGEHGENPPAVMARRARECLVLPPPPGWDGVTRMTSK